MNKGFIVSVDALLAIVILFALLSLSFDSLKQDGGEARLQHMLGVLSYQSGKSLEVSGLLSDAVIADDTSGIRTYLDGLPFHLCGSVGVREDVDTNQFLFLVTKTGCSSSWGESVSSMRGFIVPSPPDANLHVAIVSVWFNRGS